MIVVGIRFKPAGKVYYFDPVGIDLDIQDGVIVETARGTEFGTVVIEPRDVEESEVVQPLKPIVRRATTKDLLPYFVLGSSCDKSVCVTKQR